MLAKFPSLFLIYETVPCCRCPLMLLSSLLSVFTRAVTLSVEGLLLEPRCNRVSDDMTALVSIFCLRPSCLMDDFQQHSPCQGSRTYCWSLCLSVTQGQGSVPSSSSRGVSEIRRFLVLQSGACSCLSVLPGVEQVAALSTLPMTRAGFPAGVPEGTW